MQTYTFNRKDEKGEITPEQVPLERWAWGAIYEDGSEIRQFGNDGIFHQIGEVEQDRVSIFVLYNTERPQEQNGRIDILVPRGARLIHKYRNIVLNFGTEGVRQVRVYIFGWKKGNEYHINFVLPDGRIVQSDRDDVDMMKFGI